MQKQVDNYSTRQRSNDQQLGKWWTKLRALLEVPEVAAWALTQEMLDYQTFTVLQINALL
jgi:hypothetical protein